MRSQQYSKIKSMSEVPLVRETMMAFVRRRVAIQSFAILCSITIALSLTISQLAFAQSLSPEERIARKAAIRDSKLSSNLFDQTDSPSAMPQAAVNGPASLTSSNDYIVVDAIATSAAVVEDLAARLRSSGMRSVATAGRVVSGEFPRSAMANLAEIAELQFMRESIAIAHAGVVTSQGDAVMLGGTARSTYGVDGAGITIGTLSDSYDCKGGASADVASLDLPSTVTVVSESCTPTSTDEGRAMMQIITDVAPAATQAFHAAGPGSANFIAGINALKGAGASIIVDNISYFTEPFYQDGVIAQEMSKPANADVSFFSAAGNAGRVSYESNFEDGGDGVFNSISHGFNGPGPGADKLQEIMIPAGETVRIILQWNEPAASAGPVGSSTDLDLYLWNADGSAVLAPAESYNIGNDPIEIITFQNDLAGGPTKFHLSVEHYIPFPGGLPEKFKYIIVSENKQNSAQIIEYNTTPRGTLVGHANATGVFAIGAAYHGNATPVAQSYSSAGGVDILFDGPTGTALPAPEARGNPDFMAPDGVNTTFFGVPDTDTPTDGYPNFYGTSAAAAHAAGVAALYRDLVAANGTETYSNATMLSRMQTSATDMGVNGVDDDTGYGLINAKALLDLVPGSGPPPPPTTFISPINNATTGQSPDFVWQSVPDTTWYYLWVNDATGIAFRGWFTAVQLGCSGNSIVNCTVIPNPALNLAWGRGIWWVLGWNDTHGTGAWSTAQTFTIDTGVIPSVVTLTSPSGNTTSNPEYRWNSVPGATWYKLWVDDSTGHVFDVWYRAKDVGCAAGGECIKTTVNQLFPGNGQWWVQAWNSHGYGPWNNPAMTFTVQSPP